MHIYRSRFQWTSIIVDTDVTVFRPFHETTCIVLEYSHAITLHMIRFLDRYFKKVMSIFHVCLKLSVRTQRFVRH